MAIPKVGDKFYCQHCNETVSKSTFYEHRALYGDHACGYLDSEKEEPEQDLPYDSENEEFILCMDSEDRQFFSEGESSGDDDNDEVAPMECSADETDRPEQPVGLRNVYYECIRQLAIFCFLKFESVANSINSSF